MRIYTHAFYSSKYRWLHILLTTTCSDNAISGCLKQKNDFRELHRQTASSSSKGCNPMRFASLLSSRHKSLLGGVCAAAVLAVSAAGGLTSAQAATATTTFAVTATVLSGCAVTATDLIFGNYSSVSTTPTDAMSSVTATCTAGVTYTIAADAGSGVGATVAARSMTGIVTGGSLNYLMYSNSGRTTLWGDGTLGTTTFGGKTALLPQSYTVYGRVPAQQHPGAGLYADLVTVTLTY
jgi:spore coat protein U-like protein